MGMPPQVANEFPRASVEIRVNPEGIIPDDTVGVGFLPNVFRPESLDDLGDHFPGMHEVSIAQVGGGVAGIRLERIMGEDDHPVRVAHAFFQGDPDQPIDLLVREDGVVDRAITRRVLVQHIERDQADGPALGIR